MKPSRAMITGELAWGWVALSFAWAGSGLWPFETGYLHMVLDRRDLDEMWSIVVGIPAAGLMFFSAREWRAHKLRERDPLRHHWSIEQMDFSAAIRGRFCFALAFSWAFILYALLDTSTRPASIMPIALGGFCQMFWHWVENRRVQRDIKKHTTSFNAFPR